MSRAARAFTQSRRRFDMEACLVHARNLVEFFWAPTQSMRAHGDGVYAIHYIDRDEWTALRAPCSVRPCQHYKALSAQLSHISTRRSTKDVRVNFQKALPVVVADLENIWRVFSNALQSTRWAARLNRACARWHNAE